MVALAAIALLASQIAAQLSPPVTINDAKGNPLPQCAFDASKGKARLEPPLDGYMMLGMSLDWSYETPTTSSQGKMKGYTAAVYNSWLDMGPSLGNGTGYDKNMLNWFGSEAGRVGAILELTLNPPKEFSPTGPDLKDLTPEMYDSIARDFARINQIYGTPIFLRWGHEMNGDWYGWGNEPRAFIASHIALTNAVRKYTNMTAMVWAPNIGITYPFVGGGARESPAPGGLDFDLLDTNKDGKIDSFDNPYSPFWPGDDYVDWVGISLYYYPRQDCHNDCPVPDNYFKQLLTGGFNNPEAPGSGDTNAWLATRNFYQQFAEAKNKPMMLPETGSPWIANWSTRAGATTEVKVKEGWWSQVFSQDTMKNYPRVKLAVQYEEAKPLALDGEAAFQDWRVTNNTETMNWWNGFIGGFKSNLRDASQLVYNCDGSITIGSKQAVTTSAGGVASVTGGASSSGPGVGPTSSKSAGSVNMVSGLAAVVLAYFL
ncbi:glycoside hydrolase superfamily [Chytriomyces sp. MP71]|nr:glycoside hydrolase superfamily [Chytriomyces sp. MP71]